MAPQPLMQSDRPDQAIDRIEEIVQQYRQFDWVRNYQRATAMSGGPAITQQTAEQTKQLQTELVMRVGDLAGFALDAAVQSGSSYQR